jgi:predicted transcriptional regulator
MKTTEDMPMVFRAPHKMQLDVKGIAEQHMISASAVCRQAVAHYIKHTQHDTAADRL